MKPETEHSRTPIHRIILPMIMAIAMGWPSQGRLEAAPPDPAPCLEAFYEVRSWLDADDFPKVEAETSVLQIPDATAIGVLLRLDGRVVGRGLDTTPDGRAVRRAAGRALAQAFGDRVIRALPRDIRASAGSRLSLEIEFAGAAEPIVASSLGTAATRIRPGIDGIVMKRGDLTAIAMPGRLLATGTADATGSTLLRLVDQLGLPPRDLEELRRIDSIELGRFETIRIGQDAPSAEPRIRIRSGGVVPPGPVDRSLIEEIGSRLTERLLRWRPPAAPTDDDAQLVPERPWFGDFDPIADRHVPFEATDRDRLLAIWALATSAPGSITATDLAPPDAESIDPEIADLGLLAALALGDPDRIESWLAIARAHPATDEPVSLARRAAALAGIPEPLLSDEEAVAAHGAAWVGCDSASDVISGFDWLALAEARLSRRRGEPTDRVVSLRAIRDALLARQLDGEGDDAGGIPLRAGTLRTVDARSLRPMFAISVLEGIPGEEESGAARANRGLAGLVRLLRQLMMSPEEAADLPGGSRGQGGVAVGLADPRQSLAATATASLILDQLSRTVESRKDDP
ncbi:MAG: hypothetical protein GY895_16950 [Phycisphaera sp.]|nr:hypothetical protein [Phycisphaera sp.]